MGVKNQILEALGKKVSFEKEFLNLKNETWNG